VSVERAAPRELACAFLGALLSACAAGAIADPPGGALEGNRYRVIVSTDIGGSDEDDDQSMVHFLVYSDLFDIEGLVSSPPGAGRAVDIRQVIDEYEKDYPNLVTHSSDYPTPATLCALVHQGATDPQSGSTPPGTISAGAQHIIDRAKASDPRPLYVLVWGSITDVAQAVHKDPTIKDKIRVYFIASWNRNQDPNSFAYLDANHSDMWFIRSEETFRGWYMGGDQSGDLGNTTFVQQHVDGHGALGNYFAPLKGGSIKMGDTPTVAYLLRGDPADPTIDHWGGRYVLQAGRSRWWVDDPDPAWSYSGRDGANTVNQFRENYLRDWQARMDWCKDPAVGTTTRDDVDSEVGMHRDGVSSDQAVKGVVGAYREGR
jgi:hypothetical protein